MGVLKYNHETNKTDKTFDSLHSTLFFPKAHEVIPYIAEAIKNKNDDFRSFGSYDGHVWSAVNNIIRNCYNSSDDDGRIHINHLFDAVKVAGEIFDRMKDIKFFATSNRSWYEGKGISFTYGDGVGSGVLQSDYEDGDSDCYMTPGGYREFIATSGTDVTIDLNHDLTFRCSFDSNCTEDHYNNNFYGVSTGNGTTKYELGERVERRGVTMEGELISYCKNTKRGADIKVREINVSRLIELAYEYQPELAEAIGL